MFGRELRLPINAKRGGPPSERPSNYPSFVAKQHEILRGVYERVEENLRINLRHQKDFYDARCKGNSRPYREGDLVWLEEKAVPRWLHRKFYRPWSEPWRLVKVISDVTYRIQCEDVAPTQERRKTRIIVQFNRLKPYLPRPAQLQPMSHDVEGVADLPVDLNVGERVVMESPTARGIDTLPGDQAPAWMGDFLVGKDIDNALPPLGREGV